MRSSPEHCGTVALAANAAWNIVNFRSGLIQGLQRAGWQVVAMAPRDEYASQLEAIGCRFVDTPMSASGTHPPDDLRLLRRYRSLLRELRPDVFMGYTIKPNIYGSIAAHRLGIPVINNITGLGSAFIGRGWLAWVARWLYRRALRRSRHVVFENEDDREFFVTAGLARHEQTRRMPSCGIDLQGFSLTPLPPREPGSAMRFLMVGRLLRDKGVVELVEAMRLLRRRGVAAECSLLGFLDVANPSAISRAQVSAWEAEGLVKYLGSSDDVRPFIAQAHCVVLPSYREGVPRALLEAASMGRPLLATDVVGCRDAVDDGVNGMLAPARDAARLADKMEQMANLEHSRLQSMGRSGRAKVESQFDERAVIDQYVALFAPLKAPGP